MAMDYTTFNTQIASALRIARKREAMWEEIARNTNANYDQRLLSTNFSASADDTGEALQAGLADLKAAESSARGMFVSSKGTFSRLIGPILDTDLEGADEESSLIEYVYDVTSNGQVSIKKRRGKLGILYHDMVDNSEQVLQNGISFGSITADGGNEGLMVFDVAPTGMGHALTGLITMKCVDDTVGATKFSIVNKLTTPLPDLANVTADNFATLGYSYQDGQVGLSALTLGYGTLAESGDDGAMFSATTVGIVNGSSADSDKGMHYIKVTRQATAPIWLIEWFRADTLLSSEKVASATADTTTGTVAIAMTGGGGTTINTTFDRAAANIQLPSAGNTDADIIFDIKNPRLDDFWTVTVTNDEAGNYQTKLAHVARAEFNSAGSPSANWTDANASSISIS